MICLGSLAWHASGTFSLVEHNGGSNGAGLRHGKEAADPANAGTFQLEILVRRGTDQHSLQVFSTLSIS